MRKVIFTNRHTCDFGTTCSAPATHLVALTFAKHRGQVEIRTFCSDCAKIDATVWAGHADATRTTIAVVEEVRS